MEKAEYIKAVKEGVKNTLDDYRFNNHKKQVFARKLSADFNSTYSEAYLWNRALYLSTNACLLLEEDSEDRLAFRALKGSAEVYENLSDISEVYDRSYALLLSAICYDLSGYQANAFCLTKKITDYQFESDDLRVDVNSDNYILFHIKEILIKNLYKARSMINPQLNNDIGIGLFNDAVSKWYENALNGTENDYLNQISLTYRFYLNVSNIPISHLLVLLRARFRVFNERSVWNNLFQNDFIKGNSKWHKYIRLLTHDIYDKYQLKPIDKRVSKFEFWISQIRAIQKGLLESDSNYVVQMPTSAGKTFIAELTILKALINNPGKKCIYIAPFRALTNEKEAELGEYISKLGYSVSALSGSYEVDEFHDIILDETDVLIATPEKIDLLLRINPDYFNQISLMVVDEGHIVGDISARSSLLEFLIIRLRMRVESVQTLFISAVMPPANADEYSLWLSGARGNVIRSLLYPDSEPDDEWEPTRKLIGAFTWVGRRGHITFQNVETEDETTRVSSGAFVPGIIQKRQYAGTYPDGSNKAQTSASLAFEFSKKGNCLVFCAQVRNTKSVGDALIDIIKVLEQNEDEIPSYFKESTEEESYFFAKQWYGEESYVSNCIRRGIGIHYGDMPEAVRRSVESDYRGGKLRVLISTNTVGQGLNFPIKTLIIHSTLITQGQYLEVRDFWNIIGRAGRAGKETEGQIIFVISTPTDRLSFNRYSNRENIDHAYSMFFNILDAILDNRISSENYDEYIKVLSEPYLLNLLVEETVEEDDQLMIERIIDNSLFKVQLDEKGIELKPIRESFSAIVKNVREEVSPALIKIYGETGFTLKSNGAINDFIEEHLDDFRDLVKADDYFNLLELVLKLFDEDEIEEIKSRKLDKIPANPTDLFDVIKAWIEGKEIDKLLEIWSEVTEDITQLHVLISDGFYYRYTWGLTSVITILAHKLEIERSDLPEGIKSLPSFIKYGLNSSSACLATSLGIKSRNVALFLSDEAGSLEGHDFIRWIANRNEEDVDGYSVSRYDRQNILNVAIKLTVNRYEEIPDEFQFYIKGISFDKNRIKASLSIETGDNLSYEREPQNEFDPYAIRILKNGNELGFVPREFAKVISVEIDVNATHYEIVVIGFEKQGDYKNVFVLMKKIDN